MLKNLFNPGKYSQSMNIAILVNRVAIASLMLVHGLSKFSALLGSEAIVFPDPLGIGATPSLMLVVGAEVFCSLFLMFGFATRITVLPLIANMLIAVFVIHASDVFGKKELAVVYLLVYATMTVAGSGKYSIDNWIYGKVAH